jgi:hypothetical protein
MKVKTHLRVAKTKRGARVVASSKPSQKPIIVDKGYASERVLPTVAFAVVLDVPDEAFKAAEAVLAEIEIPFERTRVAAEVEDQS